MNNYKASLFSECMAMVVLVIMFVPLILIGMTAFSTSQLLRFPPPGYSLTWLKTLLGTEAWTSSMFASMKLGLLSTTLALMIGIPLALGLSRGAIGQFKGLALFAIAPIIVPSVSLGIGFYFLSNYIGIGLSIIPLLIAHTTLALPFILVCIFATVKSIDPNIEAASRTLGASLPTTLLKITLPSILPGIVAGAVFAFMTSWDDVVQAVFLATPLFRTFPLQLWTEMQYGLTPIVSTGSFFLSMVSLVLVIIVGAWWALLRRRMVTSVGKNIILKKGVV